MAGQRRYLSMVVMLDRVVKPALHKILLAFIELGGDLEKFGGDLKKIFESLKLYKGPEDSKDPEDPQSLVKRDEHGRWFYNPEKLYKHLIEKEVDIKKLKITEIAERKNSVDIHSINVLLAIEIIKKFTQQDEKKEEERKEQFNKLLGIRTEIFENKKKDLSSKDYENMFERIKDVLLDLEVDHLEIEKHHTKLDHRRSLYKLLEYYLKPSFPEKYFEEEKSTLIKVKAVDTLRTFFERSKEDTDPSISVFRKIFETIDDITTVDDTDLKKIYDEHFDNVKGHLKKNYPGKWPKTLISEYLKKIDTIDTIDMRRIESDYYTKELLTHIQHAVQTFLPEEQKSKEAILKLLDEDKDNKLFDKEMVKQIKHKKFHDSLLLPSVTGKPEQEAFLDSSLIPRVIETYLLTTPKQREGWQILQKIRYNVIVNALLTPISKEKYDAWKSNLKQICKQIDKSKVEIEDTPTLYYYNLLSQCILFEENGSYSEVSKQEYDVWKKFLSDGERKGKEESPSKTNLKDVDKKLPIIFASKDFGMFKIFETILYWRRSAKNEYCSLIDICDTLDRINEKFFKSKYADMKSLKEEAQKNLKQAVLQLCRQPPKKLIYASNRLFNYYVEGLVDSLTKSLYDGPSSPLLTTGQTATITDAIKNCFLLISSSFGQTLKVVTISHGYIRKSSELFTESRYLKENIASVTLFPPWGCTLNFTAAYEILRGEGPDKMKFANEDITQDRYVYQRIGEQECPFASIDRFNQITDHQSEREVPEVWLIYCDNYDNMYSITMLFVEEFRLRDPESVIIPLFSAITSIASQFQISLEKLMDRLSLIVREFCHHRPQVHVEVICCLDIEHISIPTEEFYTRVETACMYSIHSLKRWSIDPEQLRRVLMDPEEYLKYVQKRDISPYLTIPQTQ